MEKNLNYFISQTKNYLASYFKKNLSDYNISLRDVYPDLFDDASENEIISKTLSTNDFIGQLYEEIIPSETKKDLGQFYTRNSKVLNFMISKIDIFGGKILEPSCGSGLFLVNIIEKIINELSEKNWKSWKIINYIYENIYGNDIDTNACLISELNIVAKLLPLIIESVKYNPNYKLERFTIYQNDFVECSTAPIFSTVIGNPPYVTMYGKRSRNMTEEKRMFYNTFDFVQDKTKNNKFNLSMFFIENGLKALLPNGKLMFILDISFFETAYNDIRKYLVQNFKIESITVGLQEFEGVASGQMLLEVTKTKESNNSVEWYEYETATITTLYQNTWDNPNNHYKYLKPLNNIQGNINEKIQIYKNLDYFYPDKCLRTCCALTGRTEDFIVDKYDKIYLPILPFLEGSKGISSKFCAPTANRYIKYDYKLQIKISDEFKIELEALGVKNKKRVTLGDLDSYLSPKIFIRQSATEIIATYTEEPFAANNSIYILTNKQTSESEKNNLKYLCGILNSNLITYYSLINKIIRVEKGKTPQIKISDLKSIRIAWNYEYYPLIVEIVDNLLYDCNNIKLIKKLNSLVYKMYNISEHEIEYIESYIKKE